jgi:thioredoxin 1
MRLLMLCGGLAMVAPVVVAQDECGEDECEDSAGSAAQDEAGDWSDDADSEEASDQEDDPGCAEGACDTGDEPSNQDNGLDADSEDSGAQADVPSPAAAEKPSAPAPTQASEAVPAAQGTVSEVTDVDFSTLVLESSVPVLVFFWTEWCGPCRMVLPALDELAVDYAGRLQIVRLDIEKNPDISQRHRAHPPMLILVKGGRVTERMNGAATKTALASFIDRNL